MKFDTKSIFAGSILTVLAGTVLGISATQVDAFFPKGEKSESREAVRSAIESGDYNAFLKARENVSCPMHKDISEEEFLKMQKMHTLKKEGKFEEAEALRKELGLPERDGRGGMGKMKSSQERQAIYNAMESGDFNAWKEAMGDRPMAQTMTEENFQKLRQAHEMKKNGNHEGARALMEELGMGKAGNGYQK